MITCLAADITTAQYDSSRTLSNNGETSLNTSNVSLATFGRLFTRTVDGAILAQPLYLQNVVFSTQTINVVYVATMHNNVYAFDADNAAAASPVWSLNLGPYDTITGWDTGLGVLSTPVIARGLQALYVVAATRENGHRVYRLHALDLLTGAEKFGGPVVIGGQVSGSASDGQSGMVLFNSDQHIQRPGLAVSGNSVYFAFGSDRDRAPYHGWVFGYNLANLQPTAIFNATPNGGMAGIWHSGRAPAVDANGALYYETGNGDFDGAANFGESFLKLNTSGSGALSLGDWFTPGNWQVLNDLDYDLGSTGPTLIPGTNLLVGAGKTGVFYVVNRDNMGHIQSGDGQIVQSFQGTSGCAMPLVDQGCAQIMGQAFWYSAPVPALYVWGVHDRLKAYQFSNGMFNTTPASTGTITANYPGGVLALSSNLGTPGTGIVWAFTWDAPDNGIYFGPGVLGTGTLRAFDATDLTRELWNSSENLARDGLGDMASFTPPVIANGKVYASTFSNQLVVYGLLSPTMSIVKSHLGNFTQGQQNATYTITVANATGAPSTGGTVTVSDVAPAGLTVVSMSGTGWTPNGNTLSRSDALPGGSSYPPITVTVNVAANATSPQVNQVNVSGGNSAVASASDSTVILNAPVLTINKTHTGTFTQGQQNASYTVSVSNASNLAPTSGIVTVIETPPAGLTLVSMSGTGWTCGTTTCTRSDALAGGNSYPPITVTVNVAANATSPQVNQVSVSGGGSATANASDSTTLSAAFTGSVDLADCNTIAGWAADRTRLNQSINVDIYDGTTLIATVAANVNRPDVGSFLGDNGNHGFSLATPSSLKDGNPHSLSVKFGGSATNLSGSPKSLSCSTVALYTGSLDIANCSTIAGWAADRNRLNQSINVDIYDGNTLIATVAANVNRPDVGSFLGDNGNHGFSIATPASLKDGSPHSITVKFAGTAIVVSGSPRSLSCSATAQYGGSFDIADCNNLAGWAADSNRLNQSISVDIYDGATLIATVAANQNRPDVGSFLGDNGNHGFSLPTPASLKDGNPHSITVKFAGTAIVVSNSPKSLSCAAAAQYGGSFDLANCNQIAGWAADSNRLNQSINVDFYDGAMLIGTVLANQNRPDVGSFLGDNGNHGFNIATPSSLKTGTAHSVGVKFGGTPTSLTNSPKSLTCP